MSPVDDGILEVLAETGPSGRSDVHGSARFRPETTAASTGDVSARLERPVDHGLVAELVGRTYYLTALGPSYLIGTVEASAPERDDGPARDPGELHITE